MSEIECVRCIAQTKKGARCKLRTCRIADYCSIHAKSILQLGVKPSPVSGYGLFTYADIPKDRKICEYKGVNISQEEYDTGNGIYGVEIPRGRVIDAKSTQSCLARYINDCRYSNRRAGTCAGINARFSLKTVRGVTTVNIKSTKRIPAGSEIFLKYGAKYWNG